MKTMNPNDPEKPVTPKPEETVPAVPAAQAAPVETNDDDDSIGFCQADMASGQEGCCSPYEE